MQVLLFKYEPRGETEKFYSFCDKVCSEGIPVVVFKIPYFYTKTMHNINWVGGKWMFASWFFVRLNVILILFKLSHWTFI